MIHRLSIKDYLAFAESIPIVDVRTPLEFEQGHIPGACNLPIFSNEERVQVGICYKQCSREEAILLGFDLVGTKWSGFIRQALKIAPSKRLVVHCWRGGMRSAAMAWVLQFYGFEVRVLEGGYKQYRRWVLDSFNETFSLLVLGGMTGSGKTALLSVLKNQGEQVIDLEDLAQHRGSSYGSMGTLIQPTQEQFENDLAFALQKMDLQKVIWIEDESITIGKRVIPHPLWQQMRVTNLIKLLVPLEVRIQFLADEYGELDKDFLITCTERIGKRLGPVQTKEALLAIQENRIKDFTRLVLVYYDKTYQIGQSKRMPSSIYEVECSSAHAVQNAASVIKLAQAIKEQHINSESV